MTHCDVLIVGGGTAGLIAAVEARKAGSDVMVVCKRKVGRSGNTIVSGGNFSAYVPCVDVSDGVEQHLRDTLAGGDDVNDPVLARVLASEAGPTVMGLERYGVRFVRSEGRLVRRMPPGHSRPRWISTDPVGRTQKTRGLNVTLPLLRAAQEMGVRFLSDLPVHHLLVREGTVFGALSFDAASGEWMEMRARAVILAAGGGGCLFASANNTSDMTGDSLALALHAGVPLRDMEFVQFYPLNMLSPAHVTIPTVLFSEGAVLRNRLGERFMTRYDPANAETATRDVTSRAIFYEIQTGNDVDGGVYMDCSAVPSAVMERRFPTLVQLLRAHSIDPANRWLSVAPVAHFLMGGAWIDAGCQTSIAGLFAAGEAAGGVHGANRLAGNGLSEAAVFGSRAGRGAALYARGVGRLPDSFGRKFETPTERPGSLTLGEVKTQLRRTMWAHGSIVRTEEGLRRAESALAECEESLPRCRVSHPGEKAAYLELERMLTAGEAIIAAALMREESRGAHCRADHPARDDAGWLGSTRIEKSGESLKVTFVPDNARAN